ncbi:hypothetical protein KCU73_g10286, partial [Aureobasidium melanogenum]
MTPNITRYHSCTRCQQRKVRCDGGDPCSACQKANAECTRSHRNSLATRRRRGYHGSGNTRSQTELGTEQTISSAPLGLPPLGADLITPPASGSSRQLLEPVAETIAVDRNDHFRVETVLFDRASDQSSPHLSWPQPVQIFQLWQAYIDNVNPMNNILHVQTMQRTMAARQHSTPQSLWMVIGVAVRLAHRLGIHREKNLQGMTVFAAEMNRRLWWQLHLLNRHYVNLCEDIDSSDPAHILIFDTKRPLNLNEADLHPDMTTMPPEREGVTDMVFCSIRYEIGSFVRNLSVTAGSQSRIEAIQQLEARLEE